MNTPDDPHSLGFTAGLLGLPRKPSMDKTLQLWLHTPMYRASLVHQWVCGYDEGASERESASEGPVGPLEAHERAFIEARPQGRESELEAWDAYQGRMDAYSDELYDYDWHEDHVDL